MSHASDAMSGSAISGAPVEGTFGQTITKCIRDHFRDAGVKMSADITNTLNQIDSLDLVGDIVRSAMDADMSVEDAEKELIDNVDLISEALNAMMKEAFNSVDDVPDVSFGVGPVAAPALRVRTMSRAPSAAASASPPKKRSTRYNAYQMVVSAGRGCAKLGLGGFKKGTVVSSFYTDVIKGNQGDPMDDEIDSTEEMITYYRFWQLVADHMSNNGIVAKGYQEWPGLLEQLAENVLTCEVAVPPLKETASRRPAAPTGPVRRLVKV